MPTLTLPKLHSGQLEVLEGARRYNVCANGRRWGKGVLGLHLAIKTALAGFPAGWIGPTYKIVADAFRQCEALVAGVCEVNRNERFIRTPTGGSIEFWSADGPATTRGRRFKILICDECAFIPRFGEIWRKELRPCLADYRGTAWMLSTPSGLGDFFELWSRGGDSERPEWASWQQSTARNPFIAAQEIDDMRSDMSELEFKQEVEAQFIDFNSTVFRNLERAIFDPTEDMLRAPEVRPIDPWRPSFCLGVDWSAGGSDRTAIVVASDHGWSPRPDRETTSEFADEPMDAKAIMRLRRPVTILEVIAFKEKDFAVQRARLFEVWRRYGKPSVLCELNGLGQPIFQQLIAEGLPARAFITNNSSKSEIVRGFALDIEKGDLRIPRNKELISELMSFRAEQLPSGLTRFSAAPGAHDDITMAACIARYGLLRYGYASGNPYHQEAKKNALLAALDNGGPGALFRL